MINAFRRILIRLGKILPFVVCGIVLLNYIECCFALLFDNYVLYDGFVILNTKISFFIGRYVEYDIQMLVVLSITSVATETCIYNRLTCGYLGVNLLEKHYFDFEIEPHTIFLICLANIIIASFLVYKGLKILYKTNRL